MILFETPRLLIRHYTPADAENFFLVNGDAQVVQHIRPVMNRQASDAFLDENIAFYQKHPNLGRFAAVEKASGNFVGSFALLPLQEGSADCHLGYAFIPAAWGKGFASEVTKTGARFFFQHHHQDILYGITEAVHTASQNVLLKCGFTRCRQYVEDGVPMYAFSISREQAISPGQ